MSETAIAQIRETVEAAYRTESRRVLATLIRLLGDFDLAEEVKRFRADAGPRRPAARAHRIVMMVLHAVGGVAEPAGKERVDDGHQEDGGGDPVNRIDRDPRLQHIEQRLARHWRVGRQVAWELSQRFVHGSDDYRREVAR